MDENILVDLWTMFRPNLDKKQIELTAEKFVDLCADYGVSEETLTLSLGADAALDDAIKYYLELDEEDNEDEEDY
jgi:hypothetical protein